MLSRSTTDTFIKVSCIKEDIKIKKKLRFLFQQPVYVIGLYVIYASRVKRESHEEVNVVWRALRHLDPELDTNAQCSL